MIFKGNKDLVMLLANTLMERETITKEQIDELVTTGKLSDKEEIDENFQALKQQAKELHIKGYTKMNKEELEEAISNANSEEE